MYLINKLAPLGWFVIQRKHVQVGGGGQARLHHSNKRLLGDTCDLRTQHSQRLHQRNYIKKLSDYVRNIKHSGLHCFC